MPQTQHLTHQSNESTLVFGSCFSSCLGATFLVSLLNLEIFYLLWSFFWFGLHLSWWFWSFFHLVLHLSWLLNVSWWFYIIWWFSDGFVIRWASDGFIFWRFFFIWFWSFLLGFGASFGFSISDDFSHWLPQHQRMVFLPMVFRLVSAFITRSFCSWIFIACGFWKLLLSRKLF